MRAPHSESSPVAAPEPTVSGERYERPTFEVICLACEISSYAPDGDWPLF